MKTLIFNGSPRKSGDTAGLLDELKKHLKGDIKTVSSYYDDINPCTDCRHCWEEAECPIDDKMQEVYEYIKECDNIIIASPVYFSELTGSLLNILSRLQMFCIAKIKRRENLITKSKQGAVILCGGGNGSPEKAESTAKTLLKQMNAMDRYLGCIVSSNTDNTPSKDDKNAIDEIHRLANELNRGKT